MPVPSLYGPVMIEVGFAPALLNSSDPATGSGMAVPFSVVPPRPFGPWLMTANRTNVPVPAASLLVRSSSEVASAEEPG